MTTPDEVLTFWFGDGGGHHCADEYRRRWFSRSDEFDGAIRQRFCEAVVAARAGALESWSESAAGRVALVILLDQFTRNLHRGSGQAWAADPQARAHALALIDSGEHKQLPPYYRAFVYMPLMHAEDLGLQNRSVELFDDLASEMSAGSERDIFRANHSYALAHRDVIAQFGRFPHRNDRLGRESTAEEIEFLNQPGSSFG